MQVLVFEGVLPGGNGVHFPFIWLVVPVIEGVTGTETAVVCPFWYWLSCFMIKITYCCTVVSCTWEGVPYFLVTMSFEVVIPVGVSLCAQLGDLPV